MLGVCWMLVILLSCVRSQVPQQQCPNGCGEPRVTVLDLSTQSHQPVIVPCPTSQHVNAQQVIVELFNNQESIWKCQLDINFKPHCNQTQLNVQPQKNKFNQTDGLKIMAVPSTNHSLYKCQVEIAFPPPYKLMKSDERVLVLAKDYCSSVKQPTEGGHRLLWVWITVVSLLCTYSLAATIFALVLWFKLKEDDGQNDYMNTKPKAPRNCRRKKGVQTPIPRYV